MRNFIFITLILNINILFAAIPCIPVICVPEGNSGQTQVNANISSVDSQILQKIEDYKRLQREEKEELDKTLVLQDTYINLVSSKEVYLEEIIHLSDVLSELIKVQEQ